MTLEGRRVTGNDRSGRMPLLLIRAFALVRETPARPAHQRHATRARDTCDPRLAIASHRMHAVVAWTDAVRSVSLVSIYIYLQTPDVQ